MSLNETYGKYFTLPGSAATEAERDKAIEWAKDVGRFLATNAYRDLRAGLDALIADARWKEGMTRDTAADLLIQQAAYRNIATYLDQIVAVAKERLDAVKG